MSCPLTCYSGVAGLRLRPVPEMAQCLAYDPAGPRLYTLNTTNWLVLSLCRGSTREDVVAGFRRETEPLLSAAETAGYVDGALADLLGKGLIQANNQGECDDASR